MEEKYILHGPEPIGLVPQDTVGKQLFESLLKYQLFPSALVSSF